MPRARRPGRPATGGPPGGPPAPRRSWGGPSGPWRGRWGRLAEALTHDAMDQWVDPCILRRVDVGLHRSRPSRALGERGAAGVVDIHIDGHREPEKKRMPAQLAGVEPDAHRHSLHDL